VLLLWMSATSNFQEFEHHPDPRTAPPSCLGHCHAAPPLPIEPAWLRASSTLASVPLVTILQIHTSIESRLSQTCTAHSTRTSAFRLGHLEVPNPWRRALPSNPCADATSRSAPPIFAPTVLSRAAGGAAVLVLRRGVGGWRRRSLPSHPRKSAWVGSRTARRCAAARWRRVHARQSCPKSRCMRGSRADVCRCA